MSLFAFLQAEWPEVHDAATRGASAVHSDPRTACFYARRALELAVHWMFKHDTTLRLPYQDNLSALIHEPTFKAAAGDAVFNKARVITQLGNARSITVAPFPRPMRSSRPRTVSRGVLAGPHVRPRREAGAAGLTFDPAAFPSRSPTPRHPAQTLEQLQKLQASLEERDENWRRFSLTRMPSTRN